MEYYLGQALGIAGTVCCFLLPLFKKKWQMLIVTASANVFFALNLLFIGEVSSAILINVVAVVQTFVMMWHTLKEKPLKRFELIIFFILYVGLGIYGFKTPLDILAIAAAVFNMLATFQRDEQKTRWLILINACIFFVYYLVIGSTVMFAEAGAAVMAIIAIVKYRRKKPKEE